MIYTVLFGISLATVIVIGTLSAVNICDYFLIDKDKPIKIMPILIVIIGIIAIIISIVGMNKVRLQRETLLWNDGECIYDNTELEFVNSSSTQNWSYVTYECPECGYIIKLVDYDNQAWSTVHN